MVQTRCAPGCLAKTYNKSTRRVRLAVTGSGFIAFRKATARKSARRGLQGRPGVLTCWLIFSSLVIQFECLRPSACGKGRDICALDSNSLKYFDAVEA